MTVWNNLKWLAQNREQIESHLANPPEARGGAVRTVGPDGEFDTIPNAWEAADDGDVVHLTAGYDAREAEESFPIELDCGVSQATLTGGHPSASVIDSGEADAAALEVYGVGSQDYRNQPIVQNLRLQGNGAGLRIHGAPHTAFRNIIAHRTGSHGFELATYEVNGSNRGSFGVLFDNCQAWGCGADGFHEEAHAHPHSSYYDNCKATACRRYGFNPRGSNTTLTGCTSQLNFDYGVYAEPRYNTTLKHSYFEGNARGEHRDADNNGPPTEVVIDGAWGASIEDCYFHGINPRGTEHSHNRVERAIRLKGCDRGRVVACTARRYGEGFLHLGGSKDTEVAYHTHVLREVPDFFVRGASRTRTNGVIMAADLNQVDGQGEVDIAYHDGPDTEGWAYWKDGQWHVAETTTLGN